MGGHRCLALRATLTPLVELRRVLQVARAYRYVEEADAAVGQGRYEDAAAAYQLAMELAPEIAELKAWAASRWCRWDRSGRR